MYNLVMISLVETRRKTDAIYELWIYERRMILLDKRIVKNHECHKNEIPMFLEVRLKEELKYFP